MKTSNERRQRSPQVTLLGHTPHLQRRALLKYPTFHLPCESCPHGMASHHHFLRCLCKPPFAVGRVRLLLSPHSCGCVALVFSTPQGCGKMGTRAKWLHPLKVWCWLLLLPHRGVFSSFTTSHPERKQIGYRVYILLF